MKVEDLKKINNNTKYEFYSLPYCAINVRDRNNKHDKSTAKDISRTTADEEKKKKKEARHFRVDMQMTERRKTAKSIVVFN